MPKPLTGGCLCGHIRFEATGAPDNPHTCSCRMCQRHSGAPITAWVEFPADAVTWTGPGGAPATWRSSDCSSRAFCPVCGSSVGAIDDDPVIAFLVGVFDKPNTVALRPTKHSYKGQRSRWLQIEIKT